jgi:hypothetical protein
MVTTPEESVLDHPSASSGRKKKETRISLRQPNQCHAELIPASPPDTDVRKKEEHA